MGYRVPKNRSSWVLQFESWKDGVRSVRHIPKKEWAELGFHPGMTRDEALERARSLNSIIQLKQIQAKRNNIQKRLSEEKLTFGAHLPDQLVCAFETQMELKRVNKWATHWRAAQRVMVTLALDTAEWAAQPESFYLYFEKQSWSLSYVKKILYILNQWGAFRARKLKIYFEPIPTPKGRDKQRILDSYIDHKGFRASGPLTPAHLEAVRGELKTEHYNWLLISVWFGLRPAEVDSLQKEIQVETYREFQVLSIYQSKLKKIDRAKRWKKIPCVRPEQLQALEIIKSKCFRRPLTKTMRAHFGKRITPYGGRKGFVSLMLGFGYSLEKISRWLGHQTIEMTWKSYTDKTEDLV